MGWTDAYTTFWTSLRATHPNLPTTSAYHREPGDLWANYMGTRSTVFPNAYAEFRFRGRGPFRALIVAVYCGERDNPSWRTMLPRLRSACALLGEVRYEETGRGAARLYHVVADSLTPRDVTSRQRELVASAVPGYRVLLDEMERQTS